MGSKGKKAKQQVAAYQMSIHLGFCYAVDKLLEILVKEKSVWKGASASNTAIEIDQKDLFGGPKKEGGLLGAVQVLHGRSDQVLPSDLAGRLGRTPATAPGFRDVLSLFFYGAPGEGFLWSHNYPYLHTVWAKVTRTNSGWYEEKSKIFPASSGSPYDNVWRYKQLNMYGAAGFGLPAGYEARYFDDSTWDEGPGAFGSTSALGPVGTWLVPGTVGTTIWLRKTILAADLSRLESLRFTIKHDDGMRFWWNGTVVPVSESVDYYTSVVVVPIALVESVNTVAVQVINGMPGGGETNIHIGVSVVPEEVGPDMNPAHIIRECLTNTEWGMSLPEAFVDDTAFTEAADVLYDEGFGLSMQWAGQSSVETFVNEVLAHIDATYGVDPETNKIYLKLVRGGYDVDALPELTEDNCRIVSFNRKGMGETTNEVVVTWTNPENEGEQTVTVHDLANYSAQGVLISSSRNYYGIRNDSLAIRCALRELNKATQPLAVFEVEASRVAWRWKSGDVVKVTYPEFGLNDLPCRITSIGYGKPGSMGIKISLVEDIFDMPADAYVISEGSLWEPPTTQTKAVLYFEATTAPYFAVARTMGDAGAEATVYPEAYNLLLAVTSSGRMELFSESTDAAGTTTFTSQGSLDVCGTATLGSPLTKWVTSTVSFEGAQGAVTPSSGIIVVIGTLEAGELCVAESGSVLRRGMLDTVAKEWPAGTRVWFLDWDNDLSDGVENIAGSTLTYRAAPDRLSGVGYITDTVTFTSRHYKPYRPANVKVNGAYWPVAIAGPLEVSWSHRNRTVETSIPLKWDEASVTPETGTTYTVRVYDKDDFLLHTFEGVAGTSVALSIGEETLSDPYLENVNLQMPLKSDFVDLTGKAVSLSGTAAIVTTSGNFGIGCAYFDGGSARARIADADLNFGTGDFTIEFWTAFGGIGAGYPRILEMVQYPSSNGFQVGIENGTTTPYVYAGNNVTNIISTARLGVGAWVHIAVSRISGTVRLFVNGVSQGTPMLGDTTNCTSGYLCIGKAESGGDAYYGYVEDVRLTKGVGRYSANFTPPANPSYAGGSPNPRLRVEVASVRDGYTSHQAFDHEFDRAGYGFHYGKYYGGI